MESVVVTTTRGLKPGADKPERYLPEVDTRAGADGQPRTGSAGCCGVSASAGSAGMEGPTRGCGVSEGGARVLEMTNSSKHRAGTFKEGAEQNSLRVQREI